MSHSHIRAQPEPPPAIPQVARGVFARLAIFTCVLIPVMAGGFLWVNYRNSTFWERHNAVDGTVSEVRIVPDSMRESLLGGRVFYRTEAHVQFTAEGQSQDRWLIAGEPSSSTAWLRFKIPSSIKKCIVYWAPGHLESAQCELK